MKTTCVCVCSRYMADTRAQLHSRYDSRPLSWYHVETCELQNVFVFFFSSSTRSQSNSISLRWFQVDVRPLKCRRQMMIMMREREFFCGFIYGIFLLFVVFLCDRNFLIIINFSSSSFNCEKKDYDDDEEFVCKNIERLGV